MFLIVIHSEQTSIEIVLGDTPFKLIVSNMILLISKYQPFFKYFLEWKLQITFK